MKTQNTVTNIRYGEPGKIKFDYAGTTYIYREPTDVLLVGWPGAAEWITKNWLRPLFALFGDPPVKPLATELQS